MTFAVPFPSAPTFNAAQLRSVLIATFAFACLFIVLRIVVQFFLARKPAATDDTNSLKGIFFSLLAAIAPSFYLILSLYVASRFLILPPVIDTVISVVTIIATTYVAVQILHRILLYLVQKGRPAQTRNVAQISGVLHLFIGITVWSLGLVFVLSNVGINVSSLLTGLGIGGIAVGFAMQNILTDVFSAFAIYIDRPFEVGDYIKVGDYEGLVKKIGLRTTRLQALQGEELVIANQELTKSRVQNFAKLRKRRFETTLRVARETPLALAKTIPSLITQALGSIDGVDVSRVHLQDFNATSYVFEITYYVRTSDYATSMRINQNAHFALLDLLEHEHISLAA